MKRTDKRTKRILALFTFLPRYANGILSKEKTTSLVILCCLLFCQHAFSQEPLKKITNAHLQDRQPTRRYRFWQCGRRCAEASYEQKTLSTRTVCAAWQVEGHAQT